VLNEVFPMVHKIAGNFDGWPSILFFRETSFNPFKFFQAVFNSFKSDPEIRVLLGKLFYVMGFIYNKYCVL